jgi:tetratricopeptide (TPR) repeat protein
VPERHRPWPLLGAALLVAAIIALVLVLAGRGDNPSSQSADRTPSAKTAAAKSGHGATTAAAAPQPPPPAARPATAGGAGPAALNDRGHSLIQQGRYADAIAPLRASVAAYKAAGEDGLPYAYALFNLGVALNRSGNPAEAVPLLRERRTYDDQRETVQSELDAALAKLGGSTAPADTTSAAGPAKAVKPGKRKGKRDKG